jgi:D-alanyl-lipoteichoic acid acyltransferase DltB (MBOAT superfamily)
MNLLVVFFICGLWHGTGMNFLVWGLLNGLFLVWTIPLGDSRTARSEAVGGDNVLPTLKNLLKMLFVFHLILVTWIFFQASSVKEGVIIILKAASLTAWLDIWRHVPIYLCAMTAALLIAEWFQRRRGHLLEYDTAMSIPRWAVYLGAAFIILTLGTFKHVPFIYFQF